MKWRLVEEFGIHCFKTQEDGSLLFQMDYTDEEHLISWLLTFGGQAEVLEPASVRKRLAETAEEILRRYRDA